MLGCAISGWLAPRGNGCPIEENPLSIDGRFLDGMGFPARDGGQTFLSSLGQGGWMRDRGVGYFPLRMLSGNGSYQPGAATVADKPRR